MRGGVLALDLLAEEGQSVGPALPRQLPRLAVQSRRLRAEGRRRGRRKAGWKGWGEPKELLNLRESQGKPKENPRET